MPPRKTTTQQGLGWRHQQQVEVLFRKHVDGTLCPCQPDCGPKCLCVGTPGLPMYRDPTRNADGRKLHADHSVPRAHPAYRGELADRLLLATCNESRSDLRRTTKANAPTQCEYHTSCGSRHSRAW